MLKNKSETYFVIGIIALWIMCAAIVNPSGNFPLNDDWAYGKPIKSFLEKGRFEFTSWPSMTLIGQLLLGLLFTKIFGFSFTVLRFLTLCSAMISILYSYFILKKVSNSAPLSALFTLGIFFNPIFFSLSFTFMTDVPFYCFCCLCIFYNLEYFDKRNRFSFVAGTLFSIIAVLIRQPAIVISLSFFLAVVAGKIAKKRQGWFYMLQFIITLTILMLYEKQVKFALGYSREFSNANMGFLKMLFSDPKTHLLRFASVALSVPLYLGLFALYAAPFITPLSQKGSINVKRLFATILAGIATGIIFLFVFELQGRRFPFSVGNIISNFGLGPVLISPQGLFSPPPLFWQILTVLGIASFVIIAIVIIAYLKNAYVEKTKLNRLTLWFSLACILFYVPTVSVISFMDRYLIFPVLLLFMIFILVIRDRELLEPYSRKRYFLSAILLVPSVFISLLGTKDYLSWNRARWEGLNYLTGDLKLSPYKIEGGVEFDTWYKYSNPPSPFDKNAVWWVGDDIEYGVSFSPKENCKVLKSIPYQRFLPLRRERILVLKRGKSGA
jgi:hypothetical protein